MEGDTDHVALVARVTNDPEGSSKNCCAGWESLEKNLGGAKGIRISSLKEGRKKRPAE